MSCLWTIFPRIWLAASAGALQEDLGLWVKASIRLPPLPIPLLPGARQLIAEEILSRAVAASSRLPEATPETYRVFLTARDINGRSGFHAQRPKDENRRLLEEVHKVLAQAVECERVLVSIDVV